jgi:hypothetical protein
MSHEESQEKTKLLVDTFKLKVQDGDYYFSGSSCPGMATALSKD